MKIFCTTALSYQVFHALLEFQNKFPNIMVEIRENTPSNVLKDAKLDECDIGLLQADHPDLEEELGIVYGALNSGRLCICVYRNSRLISHKFVTPDDLINEQIIVFNEEHVKQLMDSLFPNNKVAFLTNNLDIIRKSVVAGQGISIGYDSVIKNEPEVLNGDIKLIPFKNIDSNQSSDISFWHIRSYDRTFPEKSKFLGMFKNLLLIS
ncbi:MULTISPECIES: substrate-binding domain-containing protein [unclassified Bacillus (in: firmicutes)]|uniref:substrate-binding domain-containing protein n=1 Tax=unclassified Bacillus (in: firmicutes) TaxID=185979 RepID=UPI0015966569|nr:MULTISPECIES: substrate-binding domain-containing protein [unclassified Bacillus (in: firmicutes)]